MWVRADLKDRAKQCVKQNYWWFVLACIILSLVGGTGNGGGNVNIPSSSSDTSKQSSYSWTDNGDYNYDNYYYGNSKSYSDSSLYDDYYDSGSSYADRSSSLNNKITSIAGVIFGVALVFILVVFAIALALSVFVFAPFRVGINRFFMHAREGRRNFGDVVYGFNCGHYLNVVKIMFLANLKTVLWSLLLIIPGVVKSYEYRMIPYILSENPGIDSKRAFEMTKTMTDGEKLNIFVLDLSFVGWELLSALTLHLLSLFWVNPYEQATYAELYATLRENTLQNGSVSSGELYEYYSMNNANLYGVYNQNVYDQNTYGQNGYNQNVYGQNGYNQNNYNQNNYGQNGYDQNGYGQNGYNQNNFDQNGYSQNNYNQNNYGQNGYSQNNYNQNNYGQMGYDPNSYNSNNNTQTNDNSDNPSNNNYDL